jgi:hypothetical protein
MEGTAESRYRNTAGRETLAAMRDEAAGMGLGLELGFEAGPLQATQNSTKAFD